MSTSKDAQIKDAIHHYKGRGIEVWIEDDFTLDEIIITVGNKRSGAKARHRLGRHDPESVVVSLIHRLADSVSTPISDAKEKVKELTAELDKYKAAVKQLSFELEMSMGSKGADTALRVREIRMAALKQAADHVMDYGIPKNGPDLEVLCKEITELKETKSMAITRAVDAMNAQFGKKKDDYDNIPF